MQDTGCIPDVRVFRWPGSVFGARCPAFGVDSAPVPDAGKAPAEGKARTCIPYPHFKT